MAIHHIVVPTHHNNYRAKAIQNPALVLLLGLWLSSQFLLNTLHLNKGRTLGYASQIPVSQVIELTNQKRREAGLPTLTENSLLSQAAAQKGADMLEHDYWAHISPTGRQPWDFFKNVGYKYQFAGENLARDFSSAGAAVEAWMTSNSHRENLLSDRYKEIGIAVVEGDLGGQDTTLIVQLFGTVAGSSAITEVSAAQAPPSQVPETAKKPAAPAPTQQNKPVVEKPIPEPVEEIVIQQEEPEIKSSPDQNITLAASTQSAPPQASSFNITKAVSIFTLFFLTLVFIVDLAVVEYRQIYRHRGNNLAHIGILAMAIAIILIARAGQII
jgi:uncharacterized protein YkwD